METILAAALLWAAAATIGLAFAVRRARILRRDEVRLRKECQQNLERLREMEQEFNSVCYSISHDLRAPLRSIHGFSQIVARNYKAKLDEDGRQFLDIVESNASQLNQMIEDVLMYSRIARRDLSIGELDMDVLARKIVDEIRNSVPERDIQFELQPLPKSQGDVNMVRQVWNQLIHNAVKFTRPRSCAVIQIEGQLEADRTVYSIRDNGVGFDMAYADKLFGLFQRLHSSEEFEGTGSGLALVKRILSRHGGNVWVDSKPDIGTVFHFSLPKP